MIPYHSRSHKKSGVIGYLITNTSIKVEFSNGTVYTYSYKSAGKKTIEEMKTLALKSQGLSTYISQNNPKFQKH